MSKTNFQKLKEDIANMNIDEFAGFLDEPPCDYCVDNGQPCSDNFGSDCQVVCESNIKQYLERSVDDDCM